MALWENDDITIANLLEVTDIDGGAMSLILKKLEAKGFLTVIKDDNDKRVRRVKLTTEGIAKKTVAEEVPAQMLCKLQGMTKEESHMLRDLLDKLGGCFSQTASDDNL
jgi:DNA-binding MarR family transcriptional regulator